MRVIVLSESSQTRMFLAHALRDLGCDDVTTLNDGLRAADRARRFGCDLLLTDWCSARCGAELVKNLRLRAKTENVPVIAVNDAFDDLAEARALRAGASSVVRVPHSLASLCEGIARSLAA